jgi:hypothetical protein
MTIDTLHGTINTPTFFPVIGWPAGRGEYDVFFRNLRYFGEKVNHWNYLFNFSSFLFGFTIPRRGTYNNAFNSYRGMDIREILQRDTEIDHTIIQNLIILLDIGGNRIFNKIIYQNLPPVDIESYRPYINYYREFIRTGLPDIFVNFDIGPSYSTRDQISITGRTVWDQIDDNEKSRLNNSLRLESINSKVNGQNKLMIPLNAENPGIFRAKLNELFENHAEMVDIIGIAGIANKSNSFLNQILTIVSDFKRDHNWNVNIHGLGLGGWENIPVLVKYDVDSCDVATPWRRACTDNPAKIYIPLLDYDYNFQDYPDPFNAISIYDNRCVHFNCNCPFCRDIPIPEIRQRCFDADKENTHEAQHRPDFREMRIRIFFHNVFQHIALLHKLSEMKNVYQETFLQEFIRELREYCDNLPEWKENFLNLVIYYHNEKKIQFKEY